jgi:hypothetical protein
MKVVAVFRMRSFGCLSVLFVSVVLPNSPAVHCGCYKRIFSFSDSVIDTGNFVHAIGNGPSTLKEPPFGMTFFHHPTGRVSDSRVIVDFYGEYCIERSTCFTANGCMLNTHQVRTHCLHHRALLFQLKRSSCHCYHLTCRSRNLGSSQLAPTSPCLLPRRCRKATSTSGTAPCPHRGTWAGRSPYSSKCCNDTGTTSVQKKCYF